MRFKHKSNISKNSGNPTYTPRNNKGGGIKPNKATVATPKLSNRFRKGAAACPGRPFPVPTGDNAPSSSVAA